MSSIETIASKHTNRFRANNQDDRDFSVGSQISARYLYNMGTQKKRGSIDPVAGVEIIKLK